MSSACYAYFNTQLPECPDAITVRAHLTPSTIYTWTIVDLRFGSRYIGQATTDANGSFVIDTTDALFPHGMFIHQAGAFELSVKRNAAQCGNSGMTLCVDEQASELYASVVFSFYKYSSSAAVAAVIGCDCSAVPPEQPVDTTLVFTFTNTNTVTINHGLNRYVQAAVYNASGEEIFGQITVVDPDTIRIDFSQPLTGTVVID